MKSNYNHYTPREQIIFRQLDRRVKMAKRAGWIGQALHAIENLIRRHHAWLAKD